MSELVVLAYGVGAGFFAGLLIGDMLDDAVGFLAWALAVVFWPLLLVVLLTYRPRGAA